MDSTKFLRLPKGGSPEVIVLVGNGAIENGLVPISTVFDPMIDRDNIGETAKFLRKSSNEYANRLGVLSYKFRYFRAVRYLKWIRARNSPPHDMERLRNFRMKDWEPYLLDYLKIREHLAREFQKCDSLRFRRPQIIDDYIAKGAAFITTNWDNLVWDRSVDRGCIYLHGRCEVPDSLIFPTELLIEEATFDLSLLQEDLEFLVQEQKDTAYSIRQIFRLEPLLLLSILDRAGDWIAKAKEIVLYGYGLSDYDADINALIGTYTHPDQIVTVINPDLRVLERAIALTGNEKVRYIDPNSGLHLDNL